MEYQSSVSGVSSCSWQSVHKHPAGQLSHQHIGDRVMLGFQIFIADLERINGSKKFKECLDAGAETDHDEGNDGRFRELEISQTWKNRGSKSGDKSEDRTYDVAF